jgi:hypothetical protein
MKNGNRESFELVGKLTVRSLKELRARGYRYVQIMGFTHGRPDYIEPKYFLLYPMKLLPEDQYRKEIYEPIESRILTDWANSCDEGFEVYIASRKRRVGP